jgi:hypothetical protein
MTSHVFHVVKIFLKSEGKWSDTFFFSINEKILICLTLVLVLQGEFPNGETLISLKLTENYHYEKCINKPDSIFAKLDILVLLCYIMYRI